MVEGTQETDARTATVAYVGLGSNLGDRLAAMRQAIDGLAAVLGIEFDPASDVAPLFETSPVGGPGGQRDFLNSVVRIRTELAPHDLLRALLGIEENLGRERTEHWGARVIDLDLLLCGNHSIRDARLVLPHPFLADRLFVLEPLVNLAPALVPPGATITIQQMAARQSRLAPPQAVRYVASGQWARSGSLSQGAA